MAKQVCKAFYDLSPSQEAYRVVLWMDDLFIKKSRDYIDNLAGARTTYNLWVRTAMQLFDSGEVFMAVVKLEQSTHNQEARAKGEGALKYRFNPKYSFNQFLRGATTIEVKIFTHEKLPDSIFIDQLNK